MKKKIAFVGFRHPHIMNLYDRIQKNTEFEIIAACEEDKDSRELLRKKQVNVTHDNFKKLLKEVPCDLIAIGDYYSRRGELTIESLRNGKHVLADKPLCITLKELDKISELAMRRNLSVFCMFDLRSRPVFAEARNFIRSGELGEIIQIQFGAQHPLLHASRPSWYFEDGKHGGTITDIACHAIDLIPWLTGHEIRQIVAARCWKAQKQYDDNFRDAAQFMLKLDNGCGVMGDVSYSAPDSIAHAHPCYWRFNIWGSNGMIEFNYLEPVIHVWLNGNTEGKSIKVCTKKQTDYLDDFCAEIAGAPGNLTTKSVLKTMRTTLEIQAAADKYKN